MLVGNGVFCRAYGAHDGACGFAFLRAQVTTGIVRHAKAASTTATMACQSGRLQNDSTDKSRPAIADTADASFNPSTNIQGRLPVSPPERITRTSSQCHRPYPKKHPTARIESKMLMRATAFTRCIADPLIRGHCPCFSSSAQGWRIHIEPRRGGRCSSAAACSVAPTALTMGLAPPSSSQSFRASSMLLGQAL